MRVVKRVGEEDDGMRRTKEQSETRGSGAIFNLERDKIK